MGKLLLKSTLFIALLLAASQLLIRPFVYHPFWGDPDYITKYDHFFTEENDYNLVFIGSSRTFRHVNPVIFDSITGTKSFNFGVLGVGCPYNYWLTGQLLKSEKATELDYIFLELFSPESNLAWDTKSDILHTDKVLYWYGLKEFSTSIQSMWESPQISAYEMCNEIRLHTINLVEASFKLGFVHRMTNAKNKEATDLYLGLDGNGYYNADSEIKETNSRAFLSQRAQKLDKHPELIQERSNANKATIPEAWRNDLSHWKYIKTLNSQCQKLGIKLILNVPPLMDVNHAQYIKLLLRNRPAGIPVFNLSESDVYPEFYQRDMMFDKRHLNTKGATLFTTTLATDFNQLRKNGIHE